MIIAAAAVGVAHAPIVVAAKEEKSMKVSLKQWVKEVTTGAARHWHWVALVVALVVGREC